MSGGSVESLPDCLNNGFDIILVELLVEDYALIRSDLEYPVNLCDKLTSIETPTVF